MKQSGRQRIIIVSPIIVILIGNIAIRMAERFLGVWAWVAWVLVYWVSIGLLIFRGADPGAIQRWIGRPRGSWVWSALPLLLVLPTVGMFVNSWRLLTPIYVWVPWLVFGFINPVLEEWYWRGLLLDATSRWKSWIGILGSSILFTLNHPLGIGVVSLGERHPIFLIYVTIFGLIFSVSYKKTGSLRWPIVAHVLADLFGMSPAVFLNLWVPPG